MLKNILKIGPGTNQWVQRINTFYKKVDFYTCGKWISKVLIVNITVAVKLDHTAAL